MHAKKKGSIEELAVVGIDIGKESFHLVGFDRSGQLVLRKQIKRLALSATIESALTALHSGSRFVCLALRKTLGRCHALDGLFDVLLGGLALKLG